MQDTASRCAGRAEELLLEIDGRLDEPARQELGRHIAGCQACGRLAATLRALDLALASRFREPALPATFDRAVQARLAALQRQEPASASALRVRAESERTEALAVLRAAARGALGMGLLDLVGVGAILWAGGQLAPRLLGLVGQMAATQPTVADVVTASAVAALAVAAAFLVARAQRFAAAG